MRRTRFTALALAGLLTATACGTETGTPADDDVTTGPQDRTTGGGVGATGPDGEELELLADTRGEGQFFIDAVSVRQLESHPVQLFLDVDGHAPTPCHTVAYEVDRNSEDDVVVHLTTVEQYDTMCTQVLVPHKITVPLGAAQVFPVTVDVNDGEHVITVDG
jgi:hypothetical protein